MVNTVLEKDIQKGILDLLSLKGIFHWRNNTGALRDKTDRLVRFGSLGSPDVFAVRNGTIYGIEVKTPKGIQSEHQKAFQAEFEKAGGVYVLARSIEDVLFIK